MVELYDIASFNCSRIITQHYSTSFSLGIKILNRRFRFPVYAIYGYVRCADEIVDTFHGHDKATLLRNFKLDTHKAVQDRISTNPVLHAFQNVVHQYNIDLELIDAFLKSMEMDLYMSEYTKGLYQEYIFGSAEVVGLMCLKVFCEGNEEKYQNLKSPAKKLGSAFQKVNFLRDIKDDYFARGRVYFPGANLDHFSIDDKCQIERGIQKDFDEAYEGIKKLPKGVRLGVYLAYIYYINLFRKIQNCPADKILNQRIRIPNNIKFRLLVQSYFRHRFNFL